MPHKIQALFHIWFRFYLSEQLERSDVIALLEYAEKLVHEISDKPFKRFARCFTKNPINPRTLGLHLTNIDCLATSYTPENRALCEAFLTRYPKGYMSLSL